jgi:hypothetical protein
MQESNRPQRWHQTLEHDWNSVLCYPNKLPIQELTELSGLYPGAEELFIMLGRKWYSLPVSSGQCLLLALLWHQAKVKTASLIIITTKSGVRNCADLNKILPDMLKTHIYFASVTVLCHVCLYHSLKLSLLLLTYCGSISFTAHFFQG